MSPTTKIDDQIERAREKAKAAQERIRQLKAKKEQAEARELHKLIKGKKAADTRRKILVGSMILADAATDPAVDGRLRARLDLYLSRPYDRALFDLDPPPPD